MCPMPLYGTGFVTLTYLPSGYFKTTSTKATSNRDKIYLSTNPNITVF